jgi:hypothetical protein
MLPILLASLYVLLLITNHPSYLVNANNRRVPSSVKAVLLITEEAASTEKQINQLDIVQTMIWLLIVYKDQAMDINLMSDTCDVAAMISWPRVRKIGFA